MENGIEALTLTIKTHFVNNLDLYLELVKTSFKLRYQNSILGFLWVLIKPYTMFVILFLIFSNLVRANVENYGLYLLSGVVFITFVNELIILGQNSLLERSGIILKVNFKREIAILSALTGALINLIINLVLVFVLIFLLKIEFQAERLIYLTFVIFLTLSFGLALSLFSSVLTIRFRDLKNIFELLIFVLQYATPVFYVLDGSFIQNETLVKILSLNPVTVLITQFRYALSIHGEINLVPIFTLLIISILFNIWGFYFFDKNVKKIAENF